MEQTVILEPGQSLRVDFVLSGLEAGIYRFDSEELQGFLVVNPAAIAQANLAPLAAIGAISLLGYLWSRRNRGR